MPRMVGFGCLHGIRELVSATPWSSIHLSLGPRVDHSDRMSPLSPDEPLLANETDSKVEINGHSDDLSYIIMSYIIILTGMISPVCTREAQGCVRRWQPRYSVWVGRKWIFMKIFGKFGLLAGPFKQVGSIQSAPLSLVEIPRDTLLWLVEPYYASPYFVPFLIAL